MVMRLVRDDDFEPLELEAPLQPPRAEAELDDTDEDSDTEVSEPQDGVGTDAAEDLDAAEDTASGSNGSPGESSAPQVGLAAPEALVLTTHPPPPPRRGGEVLGLPGP